MTLHALFVLRLFIAMNVNGKYGCALLAGGLGRRMGGVNKARLEYGGRSFEAHIASELRGTGMACYLSAAAWPLECPDGWTLVTDRVTDEHGNCVGPMGGMLSCLMQAASDGLEGLFFAPCDAPLYSADVVRALEGALEAGVDAVCFITRDGRIQTAFGWYSIRCMEAMRTAIRSGDYKLTRMLNRVNCKIIPAAGCGISERVFYNVNRPKDYMELRHMVFSEKPLSLEAAVERLTGMTRPIGDVEEIPLWESLGRILAEDIISAHDQPPFPRSPLDGYAVRSEDIAGASPENPVALKVIAEIDAGGYFSGRLNHGEAARIMTGAPIPDGADAVVMQEDTDYGEDIVKVYRSLKPGQNCCRRGEDYRAGTTLLSAREIVGPVQAGIIASAGRRRIKVYRRPRALVVSTGDELVMPGEALTVGKIYDSNLFTVAAQLIEWGVEVVEALHTGDQPEALVRIINEHIDSVDLIVTTGGVSVGKKDILHDVFNHMGIERLFWKVAIKPGMAMLSGMYRGRHILALSGNPYAAYVDLHLLVRPILMKLMGSDRLAVRRVRATLISDYAKPSPTRRFIRALVRDGQAFIEGHTGGNGTIYSGHGTNALIDIPEGSAPLKAGDAVQAILL